MNMDIYVKTSDGMCDAVFTSKPQHKVSRTPGLGFTFHGFRANSRQAGGNGGDRAPEITSA
jgi:hypothetical protein